MNELPDTALLKVTRLTRGTARAFSLVALISWASALNAFHTVGIGGPVVPVVIATWLLGLAVAWEWELPGAVAVIGASFLCVIVAPQISLLPIIFVTTTALLFLSSHLMRRTLREEVIQRAMAL
ncbi:hypothetical protein GC207_11580 [bacterium]|nr:hypothetical protein [bacterium]